MQSPVPGLSHSLGALAKILVKAEAHSAERNIDQTVFLNARLYPDMMTFTRNVLATCDTAKGAAARLSQTQNPVYKDDEALFSELQTRIQKTLDFMKSLPDDAFEGAEDRTINMKAGHRDLTFSGANYLSIFAIPNFYFHMATAYDILRHNGVEIGKADFLGGR